MTTDLVFTGYVPGDYVLATTEDLDGGADLVQWTGHVTATRDGGCWVELPDGVGELFVGYAELERTSDLVD